MYSRPPVGLSTPVTILIRVDLPAPLSPIRPTISLAPTSRLMFLSAITLPNAMWMFSIRTAFT
jgi:hypothetical protein